MYYAEFCAPLKSRATATIIYRLYLSAIELLPIWITFIDRIIDRIWIWVVILTTELLNPTHFVACCRVVVECGSLLSAQNSVIQRYPQCRRSILYHNAIYSSRVYFLMASNPDRITPGRRVYQLFEIFHYDRFNGGFPSSPTPSSSFLFSQTL